MAQALIVVALAAAGVYVVVRAVRHALTTRSIDAGAVSDGWIAEQRREPR